MACKVFFKCIVKRMSGVFKFNSAKTETCPVEPRKGMGWHMKIGEDYFHFSVYDVTWSEKEERYEVILESRVILSEFISNEELLDRVKSDPRWEIVKY